jgi:hypothetical protein
LSKVRAINPVRHYGDSQVANYAKKHIASLKARTFVPAGDLWASASQLLNKNMAVLDILLPDVRHTPRCLRAWKDYSVGYDCARFDKAINTRVRPQVRQCRHFVVNQKLLIAR